MSNATHVAKIEETVARQRAFFQTGATRPVAVRVARPEAAEKRDSGPGADFIGRPPGRPAQVPL